MDPGAGGATTRSFGDTGRSIDITDFAAAVKAQNYRTDYLLFDACFMANIETLLRPARMHGLRDCRALRNHGRGIPPTSGRCRGSSPTAAKPAI